jgi:hypothetical protein
MGKLFASLTWLVLFAGNSAFAVAAENWGDMSIRFVYDGKAPNPERVAVAGAAGCGAPVVQDSLVVDPKDHGVANVFVWLFRKSGSPEPAVHPNFAKSAKDKVLMTNAKCQFVPHAAILRTSQTLVQANADAVGHNMKMDPFNNIPSNVIIAANGKVPRTFDAAESTPFKVECGIHPWMNGFLLVREDPYASISDKNGKLTIKNLPTGEWTFIAWHEKAGYVSKATLGGKEVAWKRGQFTLAIKPRNNDLGEAKLKPDLFNR